MSIGLVGIAAMVLLVLAVLGLIALLSRGEVLPAVTGIIVLLCIVLAGAGIFVYRASAIRATLVPAPVVVHEVAVPAQAEQSPNMPPVQPSTVITPKKNETGPASNDPESKDDPPTKNDSPDAEKPNPTPQ
jgi:hypothetical protein